MQAARSASGPAFQAAHFACHEGLASWSHMHLLLLFQVLRGRSHALLQETGVNLVDILQEEGFYVQRRTMSAPVRSRRCVHHFKLCTGRSAGRSCCAGPSRLLTTGSSNIDCRMTAEACGGSCCWSPCHVFMSCSREAFGAAEPIELPTPLELEKLADRCVRIAAHHAAAAFSAGTQKGPCNCPAIRLTHGC